MSPKELTRREWMASAAIVPAVLHGQTSRIASLTHKGVLIRDCTLAGETRRDDTTPAHPNGIPVSRDKWLIVYATRKFRGTDDDTSIIYQLRKGAPDGKLIREGMVSQSIDDWDAFGDGKERFVRQHGHPVAFGVPHGARIKGKPAPHAGVFAVKWRVTAKVLDRERNALVRSAHDRDVSARTQNVEWMQFRLNRAQDDLEVVQPRMALREQGYESGDLYCSLEHAGRMNQSFVQAVPYNSDLSEWADVNHFEGGKVAALKYRFNPGSGRYEWVETGPSLFDVKASEASLLPHGGHWLVAARTEKKAIAWVATEDPFHKTGRTVLPASPVATSPLCAYAAPDGVVRVFTGDATVSPHRKDRDPLYCWEIDPDDNYRVTDRRVVFDSVAAGLPIRPGAASKVDMCKLLPHMGETQYILHRVSVRAFNHPYIGQDQSVVDGIPIINEKEKGACTIDYAKITYRESYSSPWEFGRA